MIDIAYIVSHGFAARMVTQTDLLGLLVKEGKKVALICPDKNDENLKTYCENVGVILYEFSPESSFWTAQYADMRKYFLEDIDANVALKEKHIWATRYNKSKNPINILKPYLAYFVYKLIKIFPIIRQWYKAREEKHLYSPLAEKLIQEIKPKVLVSTYPVSFTEAMLLKAGNNHANTKTIIHLLSWDNITCKGHFPQLADEYIAWGPIMKDEFMEYYNIPENKIHVCGVPHFDVHFTEKDSPLKNVKFILFGMSAQRFVPNEIDIVEWISKFIEENYNDLDLHFIVRPHPQNLTGNMTEKSWIKRLKDLNKGKTSVNFPTTINSKLAWSLKLNDMNVLSELLQNCSVFINSGSTLSIEALGLNKPTILTSFDANENRDYWDSSRRHKDSKHLQKMISLGGVSVVNSFDELKNAINNAIVSPNELSNARIHTYNQECFMIDNKSTKRVVNVLKSFK